MKIISISPYNFFQKNDGVTNRIFFVSKYLDKTYQTIHIIRDEKVIKDQNNAEFSGEIFLGGKNRLSHLLSLKVIKKILAIKKETGDESILYCHTLWGGIYGLFMKKIFNIHYYFDNHNVEYLRFQRTGKWFWKIIKLLEKSIIIKSEKTFVCSINDKEYLDKHLIISKGKIDVIPNGVEINNALWEEKTTIKEKIRSGLKLKSGDKILLYSGSFDYKPNIEALLYIQEKLLPKLEESKLPYKFIICGKGFEKYKIESKYIHYTGSVTNIIEYNIAADILVAPLYSGSGTKLKIIEALAYGLKTITTDIGAEGIDENDLMIVNNEITLVDITNLLQKDIKSILQEEFSWDKCLINLKIQH